MKLFQNLFSKNEGGDNGRLGAPVTGKLVSIKEVSDPTFGEEILGKGIAVIPSDNKFYAPVNGTATTVFPTGHAVALTSDDGVEVLIHVGLDTVQLNGKHFKVSVSEGQKVRKGDLLLEADIEQIKSEGYDVITPMVICNSDDFATIQPADPGNVTHGDDVLTVQK